MLSVHWYAVKTFPRHEKRIREHLEYRRIGMLSSAVSKPSPLEQWVQGSQVELPLFPSYLFVEIAPQERFRVLDIPGVQSIVGSAREPWPLPDLEIQSLRSGIHQYKFEPHAYLAIGQRARIKAGALCNLTGILARKNNALRVVLTLDVIRQGMSVEVDADDVEPVN